VPGEAARIAGSTVRGVAAALGRAVTSPIAEAGTAAAALVSSIGTIHHPDRMVDALETLGLDDHRAVNDLTSAGKLAFISSDRAVWTGRPSARKAVAWSSPLPLDPVKRVARARGVTLNDVMVAALAGAVKAYLGGRGDNVDEVVWMVPVNLTPFSAELPEDLGNHFALVMLDLPLTGATPDERIDAVHQRMERIKNSDEPVLTFGLQRTISLSPARMATVLTEFFANKAVGVLTNVPGPTTPLHLAGAGIRQVIGFAPCSGDQPLTATIFTYAGTVTVGFASDADLVPDPQTLVALMTDELERMVENSESATQ
jgi:WS/DGAT/MGAT family acyltransferase